MLLDDSGMIPSGTFGNLRFLDWGSQGSRVYSALENGRAVALKIVDLELPWELEEAEKEVRILCSLKHAHVARILRVFVHDHHLVLVQRLCSSLSLFRLLEGGFPTGLPEHAVAFALRECLIGLTYLHSCGLVHRALSAAHLLCDDRGRVCITGMRHCIAVSGYRGERCHDFPSRHALHNLPWLAPEVLAQDLRGYGRAADLYSVGILALELANGRAPFAGLPPEKALLFKLRDIVPSLNASKRFKESFTDFTNRCLNYDPDARPNCVQLSRHPYLKQVKRYSSLWRFIPPPKDIKSIQEAKQQSPVREGEPFLFSSENNSTGDGATAVSTIKWSWEEDEAS
ncbi:STE20-related kinase adapter protein alpha-like isoform X2 [Varroa jacobsoni]|uniref:Protein kinase domain-containing protein n=2 Tax=Varroa TaxID=62624 RepID=A0A7M7KPG8_VARDE|nr:STE20-related kinase adapter protein alpha-like [Varroa destructor]XP_022664012.1 STE20-related kinase adapter protein alpha-like [Varroa destructor]XP_022664018.1 STE20-related kinase adapter protein alpha-like [Varroa destructor]XP_022706521.1 STE20-related kinase adapter protein alpha-like isoform X2 [Varroa jacobsoni]XP_022706522.1 STE20-related kinase adapter protein alpha-like isoform X2 [Varroa jacobsoni]XP_022706523.1 STE20-related kinase adapter protein alpha-like isoform X2 [Varro